MATQDEGMVGRMVGKMVRRSVRRAFRNVYWQPLLKPPAAPVIFVANHHGWHDGYLMYHLVTALGFRSLDWIAEFDAFPLFARIGGLPYPKEDAMRRAATVKKTIRLMREEKRSLVLFAEGQLHRPGELIPFGKALEMVANHVPGVQVVPVGIRYDMSLHERPEAFLLLGDPVLLAPDLGERTRSAVGSLLEWIDERIVAGEAWQVLAAGTLDVNERWDMRRRGKKRDSR